MKFIHDGVEFDLYKPEIEGWEFKKLRVVSYGEDYFNGMSVAKWQKVKSPSNYPHWIATRKPVKPVKPVVEGWVFLDDKPRCPKINEHYYVPQNEVVVTANITFEKHLFWIATNVEPKTRKIERCEIKSMVGGSLYIERMGSGIIYVDGLIRNPDFIGFEFEDGTVYASPIMYEDINRCLRYPVIKDIESGKVEVRHAKFALFFE